MTNRAYFSCSSNMTITRCHFICAWDSHFCFESISQLLAKRTNNRSTICAWQLSFYAPKWRTIIEIHFNRIKYQSKGNWAEKEGLFSINELRTMTMNFAVTSISKTIYAPYAPCYSLESGILFTFSGYRLQ